MPLNHFLSLTLKCLLFVVWVVFFGGVVVFFLLFGIQVGRQTLDKFYCTRKPMWVTIFCGLFYRLHSLFRWSRHAMQARKKTAQVSSHSNSLNITTRKCIHTHTIMWHVHCFWFLFSVINVRMHCTVHCRTLSHSLDLLCAVGLLHCFRLLLLLFICGTGRLFCTEIPFHLQKTNGENNKKKMRRT